MALLPCAYLKVPSLAAVGSPRVIEEDVPGGVHLDPPAPDTLGGGDLPVGLYPVLPLQGEAGADPGAGARVGAGAGLGAGA